MTDVNNWDTEFVRDSDGCVFKIESVDEEGAYLSSAEGETFRISMSQLLEEFVKADE